MAHIQCNTTMFVGKFLDSSSSLDSTTFVTVTHIDCIGKEAFIHFNISISIGYIIRLHFGMSGSEIITRRGHICEVVGPDRCNKCNTTAAIDPTTYQRPHTRKKINGILIFEDFYLMIFDSVIQVKTIGYYSSIYSRRDQDIMTLTDYDGIVKILQTDERYISDSVMDQSILPGVGNVIKCEGLFQARIHPMTRSCDISSDQLIKLIYYLQQFSFDWYKCTEKNKKIKMWIYGSDICEICSATVSLIRYGIFDRITYYCSHCQRQAEKTDSLVTISNENNNGVADANNESLIESKTESTSGNISIFTPHLCYCKTQSKLNRVRKQGDTCNRLFWSCPLGIRNSKRCNYFAWADTQFPKCEHNQPSTLRRVLKPGANNGRYFYCCGQQKQNQCKYFEWVPSLQCSSSQDAIALDQVDREETNLDDNNNKRQRTDTHSYLPENKLDAKVRPSRVVVPL